jgi:hypothetical protein
MDESLTDKRKERKKERNLKNVSNKRERGPDMQH